jgi:hypothetical protein
MQTVGLVEAWAQWLSGKHTDDLLLWGMQVLWWGRIGKIVQTIAALTVLAEIIGPERLRSFGNSLRSGINLQKIHDLWVLGLSWAGMMIRYFLASLTFGLSRRFEIGLQLFDFFGLLLLTALLRVILWFYFMYRLWSDWSWWSAMLVAGVSAGLLAPLLIGTAIFALTITGLVLDIAFIEPLAWTLERPRLDKWIKSVSLILLLAGFHFDLLSS